MEQLEPRVLLAGDLVAQWVAGDVVADDGAVVSAWTDSIGGINVSVSGSPVWKSNAIGGRPAVQFDGRDGADTIRIDNSDSPVSGANDFAVAVVFATTTLASPKADGNWFEHMGIVDSSTSGFSTDWGIAMNSAGQIAAGMGDGFGNPSSTVYSNAQSLADGESHIAILSRAGGTMSLSVDNGPVATISNASTATRTSSIDLVFGGIQTQLVGIPFTGDIAEVRFYDGALTGAEVTELHQDINSFYNNGAPQANDDSYTTSEDTLLFVVPAGSGVLANDVDPESDALTATIVEPAKHGTFSLNANGSFVYSPENNFFGTDSFTYTASDFRPGNVATVTLQVTPTYDPATPVADSYKSLAGRVLNVGAATGVLANDLNPDVVALSAIVDGNVGDGSLTLNSDGSFRYDPQGFAGSTSFTYKINDGTRTSSAQTVTLNINTPPVARPDVYQVTEDQQTIVNVANGVTSNDIDAEGDSLTATLITEPTQGTIEFSENGSFRYTPAPDYSGPDSFSYRVADWIDTSNTTTVSLNVDAVDDSPVAASDVFFGNVDTAIVKTAANGVLGNDSDVDSALLTAELVAGPANGRLTLTADGGFTYTPNAGFSGTDSFSYRAFDANSRSEAVQVQLFVGATPIRITEFLTANASSLTTRIRASADDSFSGDRLQEDWIELQNVSNGPLDVGGFHLTDDPNAPRKWQIPAGTIIPASDYLVVLASRRDIADTALDELGLMHTNFTLRVEGEYLAVTSPDGVPLDQFDPYPRQVPDVSYGRNSTGNAVFFNGATPGESNGPTYSGEVADTSFSVERGFYSESFNVDITTATTGVTIRYTTDGSAPTESNGTVYNGPVAINTTTNLRAAAFKNGYLDSRVTTHTYVFLNDVINQGNSPAGYPDMFGLGPPNSAPWEPRPADYEMDPEITQSPKYKDIMDDALRAIPSIVITTSIDNMFGTENGIYQNTDNHGVEWERPASIEMILPDGSTGFQIDAGVRIQGGASREPWKSPKHGFRLKFKGIYGADDLQYDWFGGDSVDRFDEIVLRAGANQAWTHHNNFQGDNRGRAQYVRDQWANDTFRAMGNAAPHTDYAHVYINGLYWGLYNPKERPTADFMASYFGGADYQYDVLNAGEVLDGNNEAWREMNNRKYRDLSDDALYDEFSQLLDVDSFVDYMVMNHYGGNLDWDSHNWYAAARRDPAGKFYFIPWDEEFIFINPNDNKIRSREAAPGTLFNYLQSNDEFKILLADRIQKHLFNDGLLTPDSVLERWEARSSQITDAIIGESARWGDFRRDVDRQGIAGPFELLERDNQWMAERQRLLTEYFPVRTDIVVEQYRRVGLFPETAAPLFNARGGHVSSTESIELSTAAGVIYYTTDGSDPRLSGGTLNPSAIEYTGAFKLAAPTTVRARNLNGAEWSALDEAFFAVDTEAADSTNLRISEINYNPHAPSDSEIAAGFTDNDEFEFIELVNVSDKRIELTNVRFVQSDVNGNSEGVDFAFAEGTLLEPGNRLVVVEDTAAFAARYGNSIDVAGQWTGRLSNSGEQLTLMAGASVIQQFAYADDWYATTDGNGFTLESVNPASDDLNLWGQAAGWRASSQIGGSPGTGSRVIGDSNHDGIFNSSDFVLVFMAGEYEDGIPNNSTFEEGDWNGDGDFTTQDFVVAFQAGTYSREAIAVRNASTGDVAAAKLQSESIPFLQKNYRVVASFATKNVNRRLTLSAIQIDHVFAAEVTNSTASKLVGDQEMIDSDGVLDATLAFLGST